MLETILFLLCLIAMVLVAAEVMLNRYFSSITNQVQVSTQRIAKLNTDITFINNTIQRTGLIQKEFIPWTEEIAKVTQSVPPGIILTNMRFDRGNKQISLSGKANTRDELLSFMETLKTIPFIKTATVPLSQLTQKEQINFTITAPTQ